jgi:hypothetical protein
MIVSSPSLSGACLGSTGPLGISRQPTIGAAISIARASAQTQ